MSRIHARRATFRPIVSLGLVLIVVFLSGCEVLATEGARSAIAGQREVRALEDAELGPLEQEMKDLFVQEIEPREAEIDDLRYQLQVLEDDVIRPLWEAQDDAWAPGGAGFEAQNAIQAKYRELDLLQRAIEIDQRQLDTKWQNLWGTGGNIEPEFKALEDLRFERQRELDRAYRFGNRPIEDIWNQINDLNSSQNWGNTDSQIKVERINAEVQRLHEQLNDLQNSENGEADLLAEKARAVQAELDDLYNNGWDKVYSIMAEIDHLKNQQTSQTATAGNDDSIRALIAELERQKASHIANRDAEVASLKASLAAIETETTTAVTSTGLSEDSIARIAELEQLIADLEAQSADLVGSSQSEINSLNDNINNTQVASEQQIDDATNAFQALSASLLADADALNTQIDVLEEEGGDDSLAQIPALQAEHDALIASEEAEETAFHDVVAQLVTDREAAVASLQASIDALEESIDSGLNDANDAQIEAYKAELIDLQNSSVETTVLISNATSSTDIQATIDATEERWDALITDLNIEILELQAQLGSITATAVDSSVDARINNLRLQAAELEQLLDARAANLEATVKELHRQANSAGSGGSAGMVEVQSQIDALNQQLELIWQQDSSNGLDMLTSMQHLEEKARQLERELQSKTRDLEEELWDIDDRLSVFYRGEQSGGNQIQVEYEAEMALIQQRRFEIEEQRWALELEDRTIREEFEANNAASIAKIKAIENGEFREIKKQIRTLELELRGFYATQREIESRMDDARDLVEDKKRELEDNVLDLLEDVAGVGGDAVIGAITESGTITGGVVVTTESPVLPDSTLPEPEDVIEPEPTAVVTN